MGEVLDPIGYAAKSSVSNKRGFLNTGSIPIAIPYELKSPREKILYVLWKSGELAYHKLCLYTALEKEQLNKTLTELCDSGEIKKIRVGPAIRHQECSLASGTYRLKK